MSSYRDLGLKRTPQRLAILEYLEGNTSHPSAEDVYRHVRRRFPTISLATVYKTLETLRDRGYVRELAIDPARRRYDPDTSEHHHLICTACRRVVDIASPVALSVPAEGLCGFELLGSHVEFYGLCPSCRGAGDGEEGGTEDGTSG